MITSNQFSYPCCVSPVHVADGHPLRCSSSTRVLPSENILCQRKGLCSWHCIISKGLLKYTMCSGGDITELTRTKGITLRDAPFFHFHDEVSKHLLTCQAPPLHWGIAQPCHCKWGLRKDQGQRLSMLADCSIASTARRKLVSLHYCWTTCIYIYIYIYIYKLVSLLYCRTIYIYKHQIENKMIWHTFQMTYFCYTS